MTNTAKKNTIPKDSAVYLEIHGTNHVVYRMTFSFVKRKGRDVKVYGIALESVITGKSEYLENFSEDMEHTLQFITYLVHKGTVPGRLYSEALRQLRLCPECMLPM